MSGNYLNLYFVKQAHTSTPKKILHFPSLLLISIHINCPVNVIGAGVILVNFSMAIREFHTLEVRHAPNPHPISGYAHGKLPKSPFGITC